MPTRVNITGALGVSIAAVALVIIFVLVTVPAIIVAAFGPGTGASEPGERLSKLVARHDESISQSQERFNGRSAFFRPPPKFVPRPIVQEAPKIDIPKVDPGPPPPPANYTGPSLIAVWTGEAWFKAPTSNDTVLYLEVGVEDPKSGVKLLETSPPWSAKVAHKGGEYDVKLFNRGFEKYFTANAPKLRNAIPGLLVQVPAMPVPEPSPADDPAARDAAIEAQRLRAHRLDRSRGEAVDVQPSPDDDTDVDDEESEDEEEGDVEEDEEDQEVVEVEPRDEGGNIDADEPEDADEEDPDASTDAAAASQSRLTGDRSPASSTSTSSSGNAPSLGRPK